MLAPRGQFLPALTRTPRLVYLLAASAAVLWLPTLLMPLSPDEGGFLLVASQWSPGTSLYGDYWVDRPPLLIGLFQLADLGGGALALRIIGLARVVPSVLLAGAIACRRARQPGHPGLSAGDRGLPDHAPLRSRRGRRRAADRPVGAARHPGGAAGGAPGAASRPTWWVSRAPPRRPHRW